MIKGIVNKNSNRFNISMCQNIVSLQMGLDILSDVITCLTGAPDTHIIITIIYIKQWVNITSKIFCQIVANRKQKVIE